MNFELLVSITVWLAFLIPGIYQAVNIPLSKPVEATLVDFKEREYTDRGITHSNYHAVYKYTYKGWERKYESFIGNIAPFARKPSKKLYVREDGKVFELESAVSLLGAAAFMLLLEIGGMR